jgi:hypothetical protein
MWLEQMKALNTISARPVQTRNVPVVARLALPLDPERDRVWDPLQSLHWNCE